MRRLLPFVTLAGLAVATFAIGPAWADGPGEGAGLRHPSGHHMRRPVRGVRGAYGRGYGYGYGYAAGPRYGVEPPYFDGTGGASPSYGFGGARVELSLYREAYIGRGLFYNTPPQPFLVPAGNVISVRY